MVGDAKNRAPQQRKREHGGHLARCPTRHCATSRHSFATMRFGEEALLSRNCGRAQRKWRGVDFLLWWRKIKASNIFHAVYFVYLFHARSFSRLVSRCGSGKKPKRTMMNPAWCFAAHLCPKPRELQQRYRRDDSRRLSGSP